jgi:hypothetical protein
MARLQLNRKAATSLISAVTDGKNIVADYFSCQWQLEVGIRHGQVPTRPNAGMTGIDLRQGRYKRDFEIINDAKAPSSGMRLGGCESISCQYPIYIAYTCQ